MYGSCYFGKNRIFNAKALHRLFELGRIVNFYYKREEIYWQEKAPQL